MGDGQALGIAWYPVYIIAAVRPLVVLCKFFICALPFLTLVYGLARPDFHAHMCVDEKQSLL